MVVPFRNSRRNLKLWQWNMETKRLQLKFLKILPGLSLDSLKNGHKLCPTTFFISMGREFYYLLFPRGRHIVFCESCLEWKRLLIADTITNTELCHRMPRYLFDSRPLFRSNMWSTIYMVTWSKLISFNRNKYIGK